MALNGETGNVVWDIALAIPKGSSEVQRLVDIDGSAEIYGHVLYIASFQGRVGALDIDNGQFLWARNFSSYTGVTIDSKALYSSDEYGNIWALDKETGATLWKQEKLAYRKLSRPTVMGDYLAVGDYDGYVHLLSRFDGHFIARFHMGQYDDKGWQHEAAIIVPPMALTDNKLLLQTQGGGLYAFSLKKNVKFEE
jgi:outer membrane protein assembly factor BamB